MQYVNNFIKQSNILKIALEQTQKVDIEQTEPSVAIKTTYRHHNIPEGQLRIQDCIVTSPMELNGKQ